MKNYKRRIKYVTTVKVVENKTFSAPFRGEFRVPANDPEKAVDAALAAIPKYLADNNAHVGCYTFDIDVLDVEMQGYVDGATSDCFFDGDSILFEEDGEKFCFIYLLRRDSGTLCLRSWYDSVQEGQDNAETIVSWFFKDNGLPAGEYKVVRAMDRAFADENQEDSDDEDIVFVATFDGETVRLTATQENAEDLFL